MKKVALALIFGAVCYLLYAQSTVATFRLVEQFGVTHLEQPVCFDPQAHLDYSNNRMLGPNGTEVVWQQVTNGKPCVSTRLPKSMIPTLIQVGQVSSDHITVVAFFTEHGSNITIGDIVSVESSGSIPTGLTVCAYATPCYVVSVNQFTKDVELSTTLGGSPITGIGSGSGSIAIRRLGFIRDPDTMSHPNRFYAHGHDYRDNEITIPTSSTTLPAGMPSPCYIKNAITDYFECSATLGGSVASISSAGIGYHTATTNWPWTLQSGVATTVNVNNSVTSNIVGNNIELQNGVTGYRILTPSAWTAPCAPIQGVKMADGAWYTKPSGGCNLVYEALNANTPHTGLTGGYYVRTLESGPITTSLRVEYTTDRPLYTGSQGTIQSVNAGANTITFPLAGAFNNNCAKINQEGTGGANTLYYAAGGNYPSGMSTGQYYNLVLTATCVTQVWQSGSQITLGACSGGCTGVLRQVISLAGPGHFYETYTLSANQESVEVLTDTDTRFQYYMNFQAAVTPTVLRGSIHNSSSIDCWGWWLGQISTATLSGSTLTVHTTQSNFANGLSVKVSDMTGITGTATGTATQTDATTFTVSCGGCSGTSATGGHWKIQYPGSDHSADDEVAMFISSSEDKDPANNGSAEACDSSHFPAVMSWYFGGENRNYFGLMHDDGAASDHPVVGIGSGHASLGAWSDIAAGPGEYTNHAHFADGGNPAAGITNYAWFIDAAETSGTPLRRSWTWHTGGTNAGVGAENDPNARSATSNQRNSLTGINLQKIYNWITVYSDPPGGFSYQYMPDAAVQNVIDLVQNVGGSAVALCGSADCYYTKLITSLPDTQSKAITNMWKINSAFGTGLALSPPQTYMQFWMYGFVSLGGIQQSTYNYSVGAGTANANGSNINAVLLDPNVTAQDKLIAKAINPVFGSILNDNDFFPGTNSPPTGDSFGTSNMPVQTKQNANISVISQKTHPYLSTLYNAAKQSTINFLSSAIGPYGAIPDSTGYFSTLAGPTIYAMMALQKNGDISFNDFPQFVKMGDFLLNLQSPPHALYQGGMVMQGIEDATTAPTVLLGQVATAYVGLNTAASERFMGAWCAQNVGNYLAHEGFYAPSSLSIDVRITCGANTRTSATTPGYNTTLRLNAGTNNEAQAIVLNGNVGDHNAQNAGMFTAAANKTPFSSGFSSFYAPAGTGGSYSSSNVVIDSVLSAVQSWDSDNPSMALPLTYGTATVTEFFSGVKVGYGCSSFSATPIWTRCVTLSAPNAAYSLFGIKDSFSTSAATDFTLNLIAQNSVTTPSGSYSPTLRLNNSLSGGIQTSPSNGAVNSFGSAGLQTFLFEGRDMPSTYSPGGGLNMNVYHVGMNAFDWLIGSWGQINGGNWANVWSDGIGSFSEKQYMYRIHAGSGGTYRTWIAPYAKNATPTRTPTSQDSNTALRIVQGGETTNDKDATYDWTDGTAKVTMTKTSGSFTANGVTISGGVQEIYQPDSTHITWTACGINSGTVSFTPPAGSWIPDVPVAFSGGAFTRYCPGGAQPETNTINFTTSGSVTDYPLQAFGTGDVVFFRLGSATQFVGSATCSGTCSITVKSPSGAQAASICRGASAPDVCGGQTTVVVP